MFSAIILMQTSYIASVFNYKSRLLASPSHTWPMTEAQQETRLSLTADKFPRGRVQKF